MVNMKRSLMAGMAVAGLSGALVTASASAKIIELGATTSPVIAPTCPPNAGGSACKIVLTQVTALETIRDGRTYPTKVTAAGQIVAFTLGLSSLDSNRKTAKSDIHFLDSTYGGVPQAAITVLRPVGKASQRRWQVTGESSPTVHLIPYLGQVVQFPLAKPLAVRAGDAVALTIPTWAPVLTINQTAAKFAYRQSRATNCLNPATTQQAQLVIGATATYGCDYPATRVEYTATEVTNPVPTKNYVHARDLPSRR
jgi:hypothetical protein